MTVHQEAADRTGKHFHPQPTVNEVIHFTDAMSYTHDAQSTDTRR